MKTYCKNIDITDPLVIEPWVSICLSDPKKRHKKTFRDLLNKYGNTHGVAVEITERIKNRNLDLAPVRRFYRRDPNNGKLRELGIESAMQQCMDYVARYALKPLFDAKILPHQYACLPDKGQVAGKKTLEKWIRTDRHDTKYYDKSDVYHCYDSIRHEILHKYLSRDIRKNPTMIWFIMALVSTHGDGLLIGSYISPWLCNYLLSYAIHYMQENCYKVRRGKQKRLISHIGTYMDDVIIFSPDKRDLKLAVKEFETFLWGNLRLTLKPKHCIKQTAKEPPDMMGYVVGVDYTTIRGSTFVRARRTLLRAWRKLASGLRIALRTAYRIIAYYGFFKHTNSHKVALTLHVKELRKVAIKTISRNAKKGLKAA